MIMMIIILLLLLLLTISSLLLLCYHHYHYYHYIVIMLIIIIIIISVVVNILLRSISETVMYTYMDFQHACRIIYHQSSFVQLRLCFFTIEIVNDMSMENESTKYMVQLKTETYCSESSIEAEYCFTHVSWHFFVRYPLLCLYKWVCSWRKH